MTDIVLATLNARWSHASFGLRSLRANLREYFDRSVILERTIEHRAVDVVESILAHQPRIVGLGVYVWNASHMLDIVRALKRVAPDVIVVVGGPEVSHETDTQEICARADYVVTGEGERAFASLCARLLDGDGARQTHDAGTARPLRILAGDAAATKILRGGAPELSSLVPPGAVFDLYDEVDLKDRVVYLEASRGCPFTCSFCLSALDDGVRAYPLDDFLAALGRLYERGLRRFKFVDRTFNLKIDDASRILDFFLARPDTFAHFEMIPDRLPLELRERLARFADGAVQLEVGIQTFDDDTCKRIARKQNLARLEDNLRYLATTGAHVHADLIAGLPGEDLESFGRGFDRLKALGTSEIQLGILKRLRGAPLARDADAHPEWGLVFDDAPPYSILRTAALSFVDVQRLSRFARALDLVHNSGRLRAAAALVFYEREHHD
ncbi:MAG TPA: DUF4080 domain-containing protein, partial [Myxococcota bacterium]